MNAKLILKATSLAATLLSGSQAGMVGYWPLDEGTGQIAMDMAGSNNDGLLLNNPAWVPGHIGSNAIEFNGIDQVVSGADLSFPDGSRPGSISTWFNWNNPGSSGDVLFAYGTPARGQMRGLWMPNDNQLSFFRWGSGGDLHVTLPDRITSGAWHHLVGTFDGLVARLYYDGQLLGAITTERNTQLGVNFKIGGNISLNADHFFPGMIDDVAVFDTALTDGGIRVGEMASGEIGFLYNEGIGRPASSIFATSLLGDFDQDGLLTASDIDLMSGTTGVVAVFDLNGDGELTGTDRVIWVEELAGTFFGDADLNKVVDFSDFLAVSDNFAQPGGWNKGDFDGTGGIGFPDFLALSSNFGESNIAAATVPEPNGLVLAVCTILMLATRRKLRCDQWPLAE